ncbi:MAG: class I SAM-dependent methyltransferase [Dehalococcoidia bacterium]
MLDDGQAGQLWTSAEVYERYVGRWSRLVADEFVPWLAAPANGRWLDVGLGTGALSETIIATQDPAWVHGVDLSKAFISSAREQIRDRRMTFAMSAAQSVAAPERVFDIVVSGLVLNFVPDPRDAVLEFARALRSGGIAGVYVWDYSSEMQMMRHFWDAAGALDPAARELDEGQRCSICQPELLTALLQSAGFQTVEARAIDVPTVFTDFDDYWQPFLGGRAPAPAYAMSLSEDRRSALRELIRRRLPTEGDGSIRLIARAWAVKGTAP